MPQDEHYRPIDRHINRLPNEMGDYLTELNAALVTFVDVGTWFRYYPGESPLTY